MKEGVSYFTHFLQLQLSVTQVEDSNQSTVVLSVNDELQDTHTLRLALKSKRDMMNGYHTQAVNVRKSVDTLYELLGREHIGTSKFHSFNSHWAQVRELSI